MGTLRTQARGLVVVAPVVFTAGWVWSGSRTPGIPHATRSVSALSAAGRPCRAPVLVGQATQGVAQLVNAELARRAGMPALAAALAASGAGTLVTTGAPLPADEVVGGPWHRTHTWAAAIGITAVHLAPVLGALDPRLPIRTRRQAVVSLGVALPATAYFVHRLVTRRGVGRAYGWAERAFLTVLLAWTSALPASYPAPAAPRAGAGAPARGLGCRVPLSG
jgi:hypothetical protein